MGRIEAVAGGLGGHVWPGELPADASAACAALVAEQSAVRVAGARRIVLVAHWLELHAPVEHPGTGLPDGPGGRVLPGSGRWVPSGAEGTLPWLLKAAHHDAPRRPRHPAPHRLSHSSPASRHRLLATGSVCQPGPVWDVAADLVLGSACAGCARPGRVLCPSCLGALPRGGVPAWPTPTPPGLAPPFAAGEYGGALRALVNAHKERRAFALARPLGHVLAAVVADLLRWAGPAGAADPARGPVRVALVPVPSRPSVVRTRGHDPLLRLSRHAAARLRHDGQPAEVLRLLRRARTVRDQAGLDARARAANLAGSLRATSRGVRGGAVLVVVDDVLTTGATAREAQRALEEAGHAVLGIATVAATRRRSGPDQDRRSLPLSRVGD